MKCPFCGAPDTAVVDSREDEEGEVVRRRRRCTTCDRRFTTRETADLRLPTVIKQNGKREEFQQNKLRQGFVRALHKRPVAADRVDDAVRRITQKLLSAGQREVDALAIGELVMDELKELDAVAYIRFASVYRSFQDVDDFREVIRDL